MHTLRLIEYGSRDYREMVRLRDVILRKPLGLHFTDTYLQQEINDILIGCFDGTPGEETPAIIGCCILSPIDEEIVQLRQMAVQAAWQGTGAGKRIVSFAEEQARQSGFKIMMMHARKTAMPFYEKLGYKIIGEEFLEVSIPHFEMQKKLTLNLSK